VRAQEVIEKEKKEVVPVQKGELVRRGEFDRMLDQFDQMMAEFCRRPFTGLFPSIPSLVRPSRTLLGESLSLRVPAVDVFEKEEEVILKAEVPGLSKEDLKIDVTDSILTISGEKKKEEEVKEEAYTYSERSYGAFSRSLHLPCAVKADKTKATLKTEFWKSDYPRPRRQKSGISL
jgi:HSP20 family protein